MSPRLLPALAAAALLTSCGYIGDPLPPLANYPSPITDLAAIQRGAHIIAHFTVPQLTTELKPIPRPLTFDLRVGTNATDKFDISDWSDRARHVVTPEVNGPVATYEIPSAEWTGKDLLIAVRVTAGNGKQTPWSNIVVVPVIAPPATPRNVTPTATAAGVRLTWTAEGAHRFRILRKTGTADYTPAATVETAEWIDTAAEFGKRYSYLVQSIVPLGNDKLAESGLSAEASVTPVDKFPPATPAGLHADAAPGSIEVGWIRNQEPDLAGYRLYRAVGGGPFEKIADPQTPAWSDRTAEHGKTYRYQLTAVDQAGNEGTPTAPVELAFP